MKRLPPCSLLLSGFMLLLSSRSHAQGDAVTRAMHDEMQRSMQELQLEQLDKPYFVSYLVVDADQREVAATLGSVLLSAQRHTRVLTVNVRVGSYALDSSNFLSMRAGGGSVELPIDDDYLGLRRQIWLATDGAYKKALVDLSGKRAALQNKSRRENIADFSKAAVISITDIKPRIDMDLLQATRLVRAASATFLQTPSIQSSRVQLVAENRFERYLNSEGSSFTRGSPRVSFRATASAQAGDGMDLSDFRAAFGESMADLPSEAVLLKDIREMQDGLIRLRTAPLEDHYNGPVLFEGQAAAEVFARQFAPLLPAQPSVLSGTQGAAGAGSLLSKVRSRVLPSFINVVDDPTLAREQGQALFGGYKVDEEGVPSRQTLVVQHGLLKTVLTSRAPVRGFAESTGNLRERGIASSNLLVIADKTATPEQLRQQLMELTKSRGNSYAIVVRRLSGRFASLAYRVYDDGHEELLRNTELQGLDAASFKDIVAASEQRVVYTEAASPVRIPTFVNLNLMSTGPALSSYVVPSLLFEDLAIENSGADIPKPPIVSSPREKH
jgi:predicted Zn-dependent protease